MPENPTSMPEPSGENTAEVVAGKNDANVPETPAEPLGGVFVYPGDDDLAGIPVPPIASPGGRPVYPGDDDLAGIPTTPVAPSGGRPVYPDNTIGRPIRYSRITGRDRNSGKFQFSGCKFCRQRPLAGVRIVDHCFHRSCGCPRNSPLCLQ